MEIMTAVSHHASGQIFKHMANIAIYEKNPAGIGEHSGIVEAVEHELSELSRWLDILEALEFYKKNKSLKNKSLKNKSLKNKSL